MNKKVKVFSTPTCPYCIHAKDFLRENNIEFENIDVSQNQEKAQEMVNLSGQMGVPVIAIDETIVVGFDKNKIKQLLNI
ncbi:MAG: Uxx-star family glutaredoxin-like (seleno)protein [Candidatus Omnitrophica bacterium]|nr:Uxx-star family glutaredoxin-like (seleno)protein [Candidatus Omnitrophota bacterium]